MNTSHFPDLERCKKLTDVGFPVCELAWCNMSFRKSDEPDIKIYGGLGSPRRIDWTIAQCPSVSELLDEIPQQLLWKEDAGFGKICSTLVIEGGVQGRGPYLVGYHHEPRFKGTLPNALAEMYLWLKANNYLP